MSTKIKPNLIEKVLASEPAAIIGGLLTVHRELRKSSVASSGVIDGVALSLVLASYFYSNHPDLNPLGALLGTRFAAIGTVYISKLRKHRS